MNRVTPYRDEEHKKQEATGIPIGGNLSQDRCLQTHAGERVNQVPFVTTRREFLNCSGGEQLLF
jgi:hypothetical protein